MPPTRRRDHHHNTQPERVRRTIERVPPQLRNLRRRLRLPEPALQVVEAEARHGAGLVRLERDYWCVLGGSHDDVAQDVYTAVAQMLNNLANTCPYLRERVPEALLQAGQVLAGRLFGDIM